MSTTSGLSIPQTDPSAGYRALRTEIDAAIQRVVCAKCYILGPEVREFERAFAGWNGNQYAIGVANGTDALALALRSLGVGPGDLVFTVSHTAVATVAAIEQAGAIPVCVDIDPVTYTMDRDSLAAALDRPPPGTPKAVIPVHLYGHASDMTAIDRLACQHGLLVIEDCAQAHGAAREDRKVGTWGAMAAFSFYPTKNLGAIGDGGMIVTDRPECAQRARQLRQYGWNAERASQITGVNSRLDELQAAILAVKLCHLDADNDRRRAIAALYDAGLDNIEILRPLAHPDTTHVYHQYVIRTKERDALRTHLTNTGVGTLIHYPLPVHLQPAYRGRIPQPVSLAVTETVCREILSLPMYPQLADRQVEYTIDMLLSFCRRRKQ